MTITLTKSPEKRSKYDIEVLMNLTKKITFFLRLSEKNGTELLRKCCKYMFYDEKTDGEYVFKQGFSKNFKLKKYEENLKILLNK